MVYPFLSLDLTATSIARLGWRCADSYHNWAAFFGNPRPCFRLRQKADFFPLYVGPIPNSDQHAIQGTRWTQFVTEVNQNDQVVETKKRLSVCGDQVEAIGDVAKAIFSRRS